MIKKTNEYIVPFELKGEFRIRAKDIGDLKKKMDAMFIGDLMNTSENVELTAHPDKANKIATIKEKQTENVKIIK